MAKKKKQGPKSPGWFKHAWWAVPLIAILVYIPSFNAGFTLDDIPIIQDNAFIRSLDKLPEIWSSHYWAGKIDATDRGLYRPLTLTTYALQYSIHRDLSAPYHILNILLHALACFVLMKYIGLLFNDMRLTILSGLLFAIHPVHTEAVSGIVGRAEILTALFILLAGITYHHWRLKGNIKWLLLLLISSASAITSKEHGFMIPLILGLQETYYFLNSKKPVVNKNRIWTGIGSVLILSILLWLVRSSVTGPAAKHEQWLSVETTDRMATSVRTTMEYIGMHLFPIKLSADYWTDTVPIVGWGHTSVLLGLFFCLALLGFTVWQRYNLRSFSWGILFFFLTLAPVSNFFFAAGFLKAERILYIPSIGLITALAAILITLYDSRKTKMIALALIGAFSLFFIARTWLRAGDWKNNFTLAQATLKVSPNSPRFNNMMGLEMRAQKKNAEALQFFEKAVQSNPFHVPALVNLGTEYKNFKRLEEAAVTLEHALKTDSSTMMAYVNLMAVYRDMNDYDKNLEIAELALRRYPQSAPVLWNAANAYQLKNNMAKANELRAKAREIQPDIMK